MTACFRPFETQAEQDKAAALIAAIDKGEQWIFNGAPGSGDFGGFLDRLYYDDGEQYGVFCSCVYNGALRMQIAFSGDMPPGVEEQLLSLMQKARNVVNTGTSVWYRPENVEADRFLFQGLPWKMRGHKTHELTAYRADFTDDGIRIPPPLRLVPFEAVYAPAAAAMLDSSLAHTFGNPTQRPFTDNLARCTEKWLAGTENGDCFLLLDGSETVGFCFLKGAEIDLLAVATTRQRQGLGKRLLRHAIAHIFAVRDDNPYLYCIDSNADALRFYLREGMRITGHSGYAYAPKIDEA